MQSQRDSLMLVFPNAGAGSLGSSARTSAALRA
jgi:hypothetical protein